MKVSLWLKDALWVPWVLILTGLAAQAQGNQFNTNGNILISDQFNNRVIEVNPNNHKVVWRFGTGSNRPGPDTVVGVNDAQRIGDFTLIAGTGIPPGGTPDCPSGCADNRVMIVDQAGKIVWQYGQAGVTGSGHNELNTPVQNTLLTNFDVLITDQGNQRVIEVDPFANKIVWQYGTTGVAGCGKNELNSPNSAELLANGHILVADESNNRVIEVTRNRTIVWSYGSCTSAELSGAAFASRLPNGQTLITDSNNHRILGVSATKKIEFEYDTTSQPGSCDAAGTCPLPSRAVRLANGNTLISNQFENQVFEIDPQKKIVWAQGRIDDAGAGFDELNAPYDAKKIGDYTGLTPP
jgi:outer membrane protein assembly factor BamB